MTTISVLGVPRAKMITLADGQQISDKIYKGTLLTLNTVKESNRLAFMELYIKCKAPELHDGFSEVGNTKECLQRWGLIEKDESVSEVVRRVVLNETMMDKIGGVMLKSIPRARL